MTQPHSAQYCCKARISPWNERAGSRLPRFNRSAARRSPSAIAQLLIVKQEVGRDRIGGSFGGQAGAYLRDFEPMPVGTRPTKIKGLARQGMLKCSLFSLS